jgi:hypothetical protein
MSKPAWFAATPLNPNFSMNPCLEIAATSKIFVSFSEHSIGHPQLLLGSLQYPAAEDGLMRKLS